MRKPLILVMVAMLAVVVLRSGALAEEKRGRTTGRVLSTGEGVLKLRVGSDTVAFQVPNADKMAVHEVSQLDPEEEVTVVWVAEGGKKYVQDVEARGTVVGTVTRLGESWIEVTPPNGKPRRFVPCWVGGSPADGGGFDKAMLALIRAQRVGSKVALTWEMPEGKRVMAIEPAK